MAIEIIRNYVSSKINGSLSKNVYKEIRNTLRYKNSVWRPNFVKQKAWIKEWIYLLTPKMQIFPSGLLYMVEEILQKHRVPYVVKDRRKKPTPSEPLPLLHKTLRDYQSETEETCLREGSGIVRASTGAGKTLIFTSLLGRYNGLKRIVYVRKLDLMQQTRRVLEHELGIQIGQVGGGVIDIQELSVVMIPTAALAVGEKYIKYEYSEDDDSDKDLEMDLTVQQKVAIKEYIAEAECFVVDECHAIASKSMQMINTHSIKAYHRFGFSATPWREDGADILLNAATGEQLSDINASSLIDRGFLVPPRIHFYRMIPKRGQKLPTNYQEMYTQFIVENEQRNKKVVKLVKKLVDNGDRPIVLVQRQKHGSILEELLQAEGLDAQFIYGKTSLANRTYALEQFEAGVIDVIIGSSILQEGIDLPYITALINASGGKSSSAYYQKIGRAIRAFDQKTRAIVVDFIDEVKWLREHANARIRVLKTEPRYEINIQKREKK